MNNTLLIPLDQPKPTDIGTYLVQMNGKVRLIEVNDKADLDDLNRNIWSGTKWSQALRFE